RPWEIDLGWIYIRMLEGLGLATVKKTPPRLVRRPEKPRCDAETARAVLGNRFQVMANFVG
ncbi:MAG: acyl-CoA desaturase, partial [Gammaproteobacteria bacterium]|nr:acyl-CoA desaturase [Gammaproteobacteria bacterium]